ncbi:MAG: transposase [Capnocytophaga sp.]|nr:transposase [Capnocytophaga sp.]
MVISIEKGKKDVKRIYAKEIEKSAKKNLKEFIAQTISPEANIKTDAFSSYRSLEKEVANLKTEKKGENFDRMHRIIMGIKSWLRTTHGHAKYLQSYLDEYCYRFNRHLMKEGIFENLMRRMIPVSPMTYRQIIN